MSVVDVSPALVPADDLAESRHATGANRIAAERWTAVSCMHCDFAFAGPEAEAVEASQAHRRTHFPDDELARRRSARRRTVQERIREQREQDRKVRAAKEAKPRKPRAPRHDPARDAEARRLYESGESAQKVGDRFGVSATTALVMVRRAGGQARSRRDAQSRRFT